MSESENAKLRAALVKFEGCIRATGGVLKYDSGNIGGCAGDPEWLDLSDAYMDACEALGIEPKVELADEDEDDEGSTESLLDLIQKETPDKLDKMVAASEALVRATTGIRGSDVDAGIIDDDKTFDDDENPRERSHSKVEEVANAGSPVGLVGKWKLPPMIVMKMRVPPPDTASKVGMCLRSLALTMLGPACEIRIHRAFGEMTVEIGQTE